jgi:hypothetical protein
MLVRFGLAHLVVLAPGLLIVVALVALARSKPAAAPPPDAPRSRLRELIPCGACLVLLLAVLAPPVLFLGWPTVWVVEAGEGGELTARRYKLWGTVGEVTLPDQRVVRVGAGLDPERGPQTGELDIVVDATSERLVIESVQYGGVSSGSTPDEVLEPGGWARVHLLTGVGEPPAAVQVREGSYSTSMTYVHRAR